MSSRAPQWCLMALVGLSAQQTHASGNVLPRPTSESLGMAEANVALVSGPAAQFINPANILQGDGPRDRWSAGSLLARAAADFSRTSSGSAAAGAHDAELSYPLVPFAAVTRQYSSRVALGVAFDVPHGLGVEWKDGTWEVPVGPGLDLARKAELSALRIGPAIAWKANERWAIGVRTFAQHLEARDESDFLTVQGDGVSLGYQLGASYQGGRFRFGASYTSRTDTELTGTLDNVHPALLATVMPGDATVHFLLPDRLQTGVAFNFTPAWWWEVDLDWVGWGYVDELTISQANGTVANAGKNGRNNHNTLSVRTGVKWQYRPDLALHAGVGYDPSPVPEEDASPITSMLRKTRIGTGVSYTLSSGMKADLAYQYIHGHARTIDETRQDDLGGIDTGVYEGRYSTRSHVLGLTLSGAL